MATSRDDAEGAAVQSGQQAGSPTKLPPGVVLDKDGKPYAYVPKSPFNLFC